MRVVYELQVIGIIKVHNTLECVLGSLFLLNYRLHNLARLTRII